MRFDLRRRSVGARRRDSQATNGPRWDFAIAVRPGWHVTVFTSWSLLVAGVIVGVVALTVAVWVFSTR